MPAQIERRFVTTDRLPQPITTEGPAPLARAQGEEGSEKIVGYTAVFGVDTVIQTYFGSFNERIQKGAFRRAIRENQDVRALRNHMPDNLLGRTTAKTLRLKEDDTGLHIEVDPPNTTIGRDTVESIRRGDLSGMSFAFVVRKEKWISGEDGAPSLRIIQDVDLYDVGPVTYPAYSQTTADLRQASQVHRVGFAEVGLDVPPLPADKDEAEPVPSNPPAETVTASSTEPAEGSSTLTSEGEEGRSADPNQPGFQSAQSEEEPLFDTSSFEARLRLLQVARQRLAAGL